MKMVCVNTYSDGLRNSEACRNRKAIVMLSAGTFRLPQRSVICTSPEKERNRIEADLLLLVVCAHMACRTADSLRDELASRAQFIDAVRALHDAVAGAGGTLESTALSRVI